MLDGLHSLKYGSKKKFSKFEEKETSKNIKTSRKLLVSHFVFKFTVKETNIIIEYIEISAKSNFKKS